MNPYWKDGGTGLPQEEPGSSQKTERSTALVGDGGLSWLKKAFLRAKEQAQEEGRSLEDIAAERWGVSPNISVYRKASRMQLFFAWMAVASRLENNNKRPCNTAYVFHSPWKNFMICWRKLKQRQTSRGIKAGIVTTNHLRDIKGSSSGLREVEVKIVKMTAENIPDEDDLDHETEKDANTTAMK